MFRALLVKELREIWWLGLLPLGFVLYAVLNQTSHSLWEIIVPRDPDEWDLVPFAETAYQTTGLFQSILQWGCILAAALGLWQTFRESQSRTWHFLLYRPVDRQVILGAKMLSAALIYSIAIVLPVGGLALWVATPGTHASPFHWSLTAPAWYAVAAGPAVYLSALFAGLRQGSIIGPRWWPLIGTATAFGLAAMALPTQFLVAISVALVVWDTLLIAAVRAELKSADFG